MGQKGQWSWSSALMGAASAFGATALISAKPKDPTFDLISIDIASFKLNLTSLDIELVLTVHSVNPNVVAVQYSSGTVSIFYDGCLLGSGEVQAGHQDPRSCKMLRLPVRLHGLEFARHASRFVADVARRQMVLDAAVDIVGKATLWLWEHKFKLHVDSRVTVDPLFLDVIEQENTSELEVVGA